VLPQQKGLRFQPPRLVLFNGYTQSRCGTAQSAMGPFYCPLDQRIYLDTPSSATWSGASAAAEISPTPM
jgi:predicted metalloprotease